MADPTILEVAKKVEARIRRLRRLDDAEELLSVVLSSYREVLRSWPWGFALQRYRTRLPGASQATVALTNGSQSVTLVSGSADWSLYPTISLPGRRPLYTDGGGSLVDPWLGSTGTYDCRIIYNVIPLFDVQVWGIAVTNVGPLLKMSHVGLETIDPNREKIGRPKAFVPYTPYTEVWPAPDLDYDVDVWLVPMPPSQVDPSVQVAAPLEDAVVYKAISHLLAQTKPDLVAYYEAEAEKSLAAVKSSDAASYSWPEFHLVYEAAETPIEFNFRIVL